MDIQAQKDDLIKWLSDLKDPKTIDLLSSIKLSSVNEKKVAISKEQEEAIKEGLQSIKSGRTKSHKEAQKDTHTKYPNLF
ncbi:hypothetical protein [Ekhidna sp.]|uniref:hypothetical protein n=1 Tax=Ekhidna sp. TaxID=2608089 RepID=UPI003CCBCE47